MSRFFQRLFSLALEVCTETFPPVEHQFRIIRTVFCNKVQKQLNISPDAKSFSPMFNLGSSINTRVTSNISTLVSLKLGGFRCTTEGPAPFGNWIDTVT